ncbi:MAG: DEAD/DEAH box helicase family protein [Eubacteriales bacterium]
MSNTINVTVQEEKKQEFISDKIGEEYKWWLTGRERYFSASNELLNSKREGFNRNNWYDSKYDNFPGDIITIDAPTGSGKTTFIFEKLLTHAIYKNQKILYLVNRKILKEQLEKKLNEKSMSIQVELRVFARNHLEIYTYQEVEKGIKNGDIIHLRKRYDYIIFDECHYFYEDALFNANTYYCWNALLVHSLNSVRIFLSATMKNMETYIKNSIENYNEIYEQEYKRLNPENIENADITRKFQEFPYTIDRDYSYISYSPLANSAMLIDYIKADIDSKWLIFLNDKSRCKELKQMIEGIDPSVNVTIFDSGFRTDESIEEDVKELTTKDAMKARVIIATSVLDNGVSIHDEELRNVVLETDTEESFIQMIGRKRVENETVKVFHLLQDIVVYKRRLERLYKISDYIECIRHNLPPIGSYQLHLGRSMVNVNTYIPNASPYYVKQSYVLEGILERANKYELLRTVCCELDGVLYFNSFSVGKVYNLFAFYQKLIHDLENDKMALYKMQGRWLGISEDDLESSIVSYDEEQKLKMRELLSQYLDKEITKEERVAIQSENKKLFLYVATKANVSTNAIERKGNTLSKKDMTTILEYIGLDYECQKGTEKDTVIFEKKHLPN